MNGCSNKSTQNTSKIKVQDESCLMPTFNSKFLSVTAGKSFYQCDEFPSQKIESDFIDKIFKSDLKYIVYKSTMPNDSNVEILYYKYTNHMDTIDIVKVQKVERIIIANISDTLFGFDNCIKPGISKSNFTNYFNMKDEMNDSIFLFVPEKSTQINFYFKNERLTNIQFECFLSVDDM